MYGTVAASTLVLLAQLGLSSASPLDIRASGCCFHLNASGGPGGKVGQLSDGQNRIGQSGLPTPQGQYCLNNAGLTDSFGRGCILTPPTTQLQCDVGATPTGGFSVACGGNLQYNNNSTFFACPTGDNGGYNIYTVPVKNQQGCVTVTLNADNQACQSGCPAPSPKPTSSAAPAPSPKPASGCPADLPSAFEFPHLIIPVDSSKPNTAASTSYNGQASGSISSIFNFDIPQSLSGKTCKLEFLLPQKNQLQTSSYTLSGSGAVDFAQLSGPAVQGTTYNNKPSVQTDFGTTTLVPGNAYTIKSFACPAGQRIGFSLSPKDSTSLTYFQDYNPCPLGLYITSS